MLGGDNGGSSKTKIYHQGGLNMTPQEMHEYNKQHAISSISFPAVCKTEFTIQLREWIEGWLALAYEAGFKAAKGGEL